MAPQEGNTGSAFNRLKVAAELAALGAIAIGVGAVTTIFRNRTAPVELPSNGELPGNGWRYVQIGSPPDVTPGE